jgi:hypothetical protein
MELSLQPNKFETEEIVLSKPVGQVIIEKDRTVNLAELTVKQPPAPHRPAPPKGGGEAFPFRVGKVKIEDGRMLFADHSLSPQFAAHIHNLRGTVSGISSESRAGTRILLDGDIDRYGDVKIDGELNPYDFKQSSDITMIFRNVDMSSITPYSGKFAGRKIESGKLSLDLKYKIQNSKLEGDNTIIVDSLVLGPHVDSPEAINLPLDLAVAILRDSNGRINIGLPVSGDLANPTFRIGPLLWKAFENLLAKAVTAPFHALASLFGGDKRTFDSVEFEPGKANLAPPEKEKLAKVADALKQRPQLKLVIRGCFSSEADGLEFRQRRVRGAVAAQLGIKLEPGADAEPVDFNDSKARKALRKLFTERFGAPALDELDRAVKEGKINPRKIEAPSRSEGKDGRFQGLSKIVKSLKLYRLVPGARSPEQSELMASEIYVRLVENEPEPAKELSDLGALRASAVIKQMRDASGIAEDRLVAAAPEPAEGDKGLSAALTMDAMAANR